jgi:hypothetical protein
MDMIAHALHLAEKPKLRAEGGGTATADSRAIEGYDFLHGLIRSSGSGRTDTLPLNVPSGAYVLPADIVSGLGQGNTIAGAKILDRVFSGMPYHAANAPYGSRMPSATRGPGVPGAPERYSGQQRSSSGGAPPSNPGPAVPPPASPGGYGSKPHMATGGIHGGLPPNKHQRVPIIAAGGEYVVHPEDVRFIGGGDMKKGFNWLDNFVKDVRERTRKTLGRLPGPAKD